MFKKSPVLALLIVALAGIVLAQEKADRKKTNETSQAKSNAPSLDELKTIVQPILEPLNLSAEQKRKADGVMTDDAWKGTLDSFDTRRGREIFRSSLKTTPEVMPKIMGPKMMKYTMQKMMKERMAKNAGPPTPEEIAAVRAATQKRMRAKLGPSIMGNVEELTAGRVKEMLHDNKVLVRVLAETVAAAALTDEQTKKFDKILTDAGYPAELIHGPDAVLEERVQKMLEKLADEVIAELKKADEASRNKAESDKK